jgi:electron transfer flavoprotein beta subunit
MGLRRLGSFDLILCGVESTDSTTGQVGPQLAEEMQVPHVTLVEKIEKNGDLLRLDRVSDGFREIIEVAPPVLLTISRESGFLRLSTLLDIHDAYARREIECLSFEDLGAEESKIGIAGSGIQVVELSEVSKEKSCEFITSDLRRQAQILMERLTQKNLIE